MVALGGGAFSDERGTPVKDRTEDHFLETRMKTPPAGERGGNHSNCFKDIRTENGSSQGHNLVLTGLLVPSSFDSGPPGAHTEAGPSRGTTAFNTDRHQHGHHAFPAVQTKFR